MSLTQNVYGEMLRGIIVGEIAQGESLSEVKLAEQFETSRTPVREACIHLYKEGFLRSTPNKGYVVTEISLDEIRELYQLRRILEPEAAALAASNDLEPFFLRSCAALLEEQAFIVDGDRTYQAYLKLSEVEYSFHHGIAQASGNKKLAKFLREIMNQFRRFYYVCFRRSPWLKESVEEHRGVLEAIQLRDAALARQLMDDHIRKGTERGFQLILAHLPHLREQEKAELT